MRKSLAVSMMAFVVLSTAAFSAQPVSHGGNQPMMTAPVEMTELAMPVDISKVSRLATDSESRWIDERIATFSTSSVSVQSADVSDTDYQRLGYLATEIYPKDSYHQRNNVVIRYVGRPGSSCVKGRYITSDGIGHNLKSRCMQYDDYVLYNLLDGAVTEEWPDGDVVFQMWIVGKHIYRLQTSVYVWYGTVRQLGSPQIGELSRWGNGNDLKVDGYFQSPTVGINFNIMDRDVNSDGSVTVKDALSMFWWEPNLFITVCEGWQCKTRAYSPSDQIWRQ